MATLSSSNLTYADWAKRTDPDGKIPMIVEVLGQVNEILDDAVVVEANSETGHKTTIRTGLPSPSWRLLNGGVGNSKSTTAQVIDSMGMLEVYSEVDKSLADLAGNTAAFRWSEDKAFIEGMSQEMARTLIYGNINENPAGFHGLAARYTAISGAAYANSMVDAGGESTDNTSIWLVGWSENTVHMIFPKGQKAGLQHNDKGQVTLRAADDTAGVPSQFEGYRTHYKWDAGLCIRDWRYAVRICNIDVSDLSGGSPANIINAMIRAYHRVPSIRGARFAWYCNRTISTWLDIQATNKTNVLLNLSEFDGKMVTTFRKIPIRTVDQILNNEDRVV